MPRYEIGTVFVERSLVLRKEDGTEYPAFVRIGQPFFSKEHDVWQCPYEVELEGDKDTFAVYGIDSAQALAGALKAIDAVLTVKAKQVPGQFLWYGKPYTTILDPVDHVRSK